VSPATIGCSIHRRDDLCTSDVGQRVQIRGQGGLGYARLEHERRGLQQCTCATLVRSMYDKKQSICSLAIRGELYVLHWLVKIDVMKHHASFEVDK
jgi:hypothetical protein